MIALVVLLAAFFTGAADQKLEVRLGQNGKTTFDVAGLDADTLARLAQADLKKEQWLALFAVYVKQDRPGSDRPPVLGEHRIEEGLLRFEPRFPPRPGVRYEAVFHSARLPGSTNSQARPIVVELSLPRPAPAAPTRLLHIYPSRDRLPENQLKFYLHFSAPMSRGEAYDHVRLLDETGKEVAHSFLELGEELWDPRGQRFTLFFHPGRVKRGLKPREEEGPILVEGKTYTLVIDRAWPDADGNPLRETVCKKFHVLPPDDESPDPAKWKVEPPRAGTTSPLVVRFAEPLDHAMLERVLGITDDRGRQVPGQITVETEETTWKFTPGAPWQAGMYHLVVENILEDLAGNSIERPFEVDVFRPIQRKVEATQTRLLFRVRP